MKPVEVRLQNSYAGSGIEKEPVVCWKYGNTAGVHSQQACRIKILEDEDCIYDSGEIRSKMQNNYGCDCAMKTHGKYQIIVSAEDENGKWEDSEPYSFLGGIIPSEWKAQWISGGLNRPHYLGKAFSLKKKVRFAAVSVAGVGQYRMTVNGRGTDDSVLNGSWTNYDRHIHYQTYEISSMLQEENQIVLEVGNGWYCADTKDTRHFYTKYSGYHPYGPYPAAIAQFTIVFEDGERITIGTDESWQWQESETIYTNIYGSEDYDARLEGEKEWLPCITVEKNHQPKGKLIPMLYPPLKIKKTYQGIFLKELEDGSYLYDFGQNMSGLFEIEVIGKRGTMLRIIPVEKLDVLGNPWPTVDSWCCYILKGEGKERWKPKFTYGGGRYLIISLDQECGVTEYPEVCQVLGHFITSSAKDTGSFFCSDYRYMQIHDLVLRAVESNLYHVHTDCPTIERLGWQEPNHLMAPSIFYTKEAECLWEKFSMDQRDGQYGEREQDEDKGVFPHQYSAGLLPSIAPAYAKFLEDCGAGSFWDITPWGSSILLGALELYHFTGNRRLLKQNYETAKKYVDYLYEKYLDYPKIYNKPAHLHFLCHGLGDWGIQQNQGEARENIETAYLYRDMIVLSRIAEWLGKEKDRDYYSERAAEVLKAYNKELLVWNPMTGEWAYDAYDKVGITPTQATQAIPLQFEMVPEEKKESVIRSFLLTCEEGRLQTGEIGLPYILRTLGELGEADLMQKMIFQKSHPSYYRFVEKGETTLPEFWRDDARSRNHDMMGAILEWLYRYMAGISSDNGYQYITIAPVLPDGVHYLKCSYEAITGTVEVTVLQEETMKIEVCIPPNTEGEICVGKKRIPIKGGRTYRLVKENGI